MNPGSEVPRARILLVDDEPNILKAVGRLLRDDYDTVSATSGPEGLEILAREPPFAVVLSDMMMPIMRGSEFLRLVRDEAPETTRMLLTGHATIQAAIEAVNMADVYRFLLKPCGPDDLQRAVADAVAHHRLITNRRVLQEETERLNRELQREIVRNDEILQAVLPASVVSELKEKGAVPPRDFDDVAVLFCDIAEFTAYCNDHPTDEVVDKLSQIFSAFEELMSKFGMEKIKTIGDAFMATANLLLPQERALEQATACGIAMIELAKDLNLGWEVRVGIHSGPVMGGVLGQKKYQMDLWGNTVNVAARLASVAYPGKVLLTLSDWERIAPIADGRSIGRFALKGKGEVELFAVESLRQRASS